MNSNRLQDLGRSRRSLTFLNAPNEKFYRHLKCTIFSEATRSLFQNVSSIKVDWIGRSLSVRPGKWLLKERLFKIQDSQKRRNPSVFEIPRLIKSFQTQRRMKHGKRDIVTRYKSMRSISEYDKYLRSDQKFPRLVMASALRLLQYLIQFQWQTEWLRYRLAKM